MASKQLDKVLKQIESFDAVTLIELNHIVCKQITEKRQEEARTKSLEFKAGDKVRAVGRTGRVLLGVIQKVNITRVKVLNEADQRIWNVPFDMLEKVA